MILRILANGIVGTCLDYLTEYIEVDFETIQKTAYETIVKVLP